MLILASASPRRADLLREAGIEIDIQPADVNEDVEPGEAPEVDVRRVAEAKGRAISRRMSGRFVLAADTAVVVEGQILGKPASDEDAARMLRLLSGRSHLVISGVCVMKDGEPAVPTEVETSVVEFADLSPARDRRGRLERGINGQGRGLWHSRPRIPLRDSYRRVVYKRCRASTASLTK